MIMFENHLLFFFPPGYSFLSPILVVFSFTYFWYMWVTVLCIFTAVHLIQVNLRVLLQQLIIETFV